MKCVKKITNIILIAVLALGFSVGSLALTPSQEASAVGVIGSNAIKSVVIGSMEKAGVSFASKEAKDKAFDAWNMKAYDKWKADEAAGRNADLWAQWHAFEANPSSMLKPVPDAPSGGGVGRFLLDATVFGMAIGIGADIGFAIQDAQINNSRMAYLAEGPKPYEGVSYNSQLGLTLTEQKVNNSGFTWYYKRLTDKNGNFISSAQSPYENDPDTWVHVSGYRTFTDGGKQYVEITYGYQDRSSYGQLTSASGRKTTLSIGALNINESGVRYDIVPKIDDVPRIAPVPELAPLIAPSPDLASIPEILPPNVPVEVIIPEAPEIDPFWDGEINEPYTPPVPGDNPDPNKPPGDDTDPDNPPGTNPDGDPDAPPGTNPDGDPDAPPGTNPDGDTDAPPKEDEETPPGKDEEQPPKEDEENSCDASLKKPDFKKVGVAFTHAFPFSLPWDLKRFFDAAFSGIGSEKPSVDLTFLGDGVTLTIPDYFDSWVDIAKNLMVIMFDISLIWMFARFMQRGGGD